MEGNEEHQKVTAEWMSDQRVDDTGSDRLMMIFAGGGLTIIAGAIASMGLYMHFLPRF